ncbi:hypothetical protein [Enhygromyxa salina]|uniref:hypothetical protein n=1 Tax=Enhygromyxa salina TaxID=215803 RepID=UPI0011B22CAC|nr:hypothetical protein [Enhygromyxa salina]
MSRALVITALVGVIVACVGALLSAGAPTREAAVEAMAARSLDELGLLAGVADDEGELLREEPLGVEVISDGGPLWAVDSVERAVGASPYFALANSPHLLRTEIIDERGAIALQLHLWRGGWELREPEPLRARVAPWAAVVAGLFGAALALFTRRLSVGIAGAGALAQLGLALDPLPRHLFPPRGLLDAWANGPLFGRLVPMIRQMSSLQLGIVAAALAASLVLVAFDHRRTRGRDGDVGLGPASLAALLGTLGALAWVEAASRGSLFAACDLRVGAYFGWLALAGLLVAWLPALHLAREAWRAKN